MCVDIIVVQGGAPTYRSMKRLVLIRITGVLIVMVRASTSAARRTTIVAAPEIVRSATHKLSTVLITAPDRAPTQFGWQ